MAITLSTAFVAPTMQTVLWELPPEWLKRNNRVMTKASLREVPREWHKRFLPQHFKIGAELRYQYKKRSEAYLRRKARTTKSHKGLRNPLAYSWRTKNQLVGQPPILTGTAEQAKGKWKVPWYITMIPKTRNAPILGQELTRTTTLESEILKAIYVRRFSKFLKKVRRRSARRRRIT